MQDETYYFIEALIFHNELLFHKAPSILRTLFIIMYREVTVREQNFCQSQQTGWLNIHSPGHSQGGEGCNPQFLFASSKVLCCATQTKKMHQKILIFKGAYF